MTDRGVFLDLVDAVDLIGALDFVADWLTSDRNRLTDSLCCFASEHYDIDDLHADLVRLAGLVGHARNVALDDLGAPR